MIGHVIKIALGIGLLEVDRGRQRLIAQRQHTDAGLSVLALRDQTRSEEHTSELQSRLHLVCRLLLEKKIWSIGTGLAVVYGLTDFAAVTGVIMIRLEYNESEQRFDQEDRHYGYHVPRLVPA